MTAPDEQDRRIAAWFDDVPGRLPERTIDAALAHARAHPRRRDPLAALRRDPMGSGGFGLGGPAKPLPVIAALGLLLAAAFAGAAVGGWFDRDPAIVPPTVSPSPSVAPPSVAPPSVAPPSVAPPSDAPTIGPNPEIIRVDLIEHLGLDAFVDVTDASFALVEAVSGDPGDGVDVAPDTIRIENDPADPATVVLTWAGGVCDTSHALTIEPDARTLRLTRPACSGDTLGGVGHVLRLTFDAPAPAAEFDATLETTP